MQKAFQSALISTFVSQRLDIMSNSSFLLRDPKNLLLESHINNEHMSVIVIYLIFL
jgi:hypothetical protein